MLFQTTLTESDILISNRSSVFDLQSNRSKGNYYKDKQNHGYKIQISLDANNLDISVSNFLTNYVSHIDAIFMAINGSYESGFLVVPEASTFPQLSSAQAVPRILQLHPYMKPTSSTHQQTRFNAASKIYQPIWNKAILPDKTELRSNPHQSENYVLQPSLIQTTSPNRHFQSL